MAKGAAYGEGHAGVRVVVAGDRGTGKSSLITTAATGIFPMTVPLVLPPTRLPEDFYPDRGPITIIDTSSRLEDRGILTDELKQADVVVLTYACHKLETRDRLTTFWLPELRRLEVKVPVIVVGCKLDLRDDEDEDEQVVSLEQVMSPIMQQHREIDTCLECSSFKKFQVPEVFYYAQTAALCPSSPLYDAELLHFKPSYVKALKHIFIQCDHDNDGALNDEELNNFQVKCFNAPLKPDEIVGVKRIVEERIPDGVNEYGLTLEGFLLLHEIIFEKQHLETLWTALRKFEYNNELELT